MKRKLRTGFTTGTAAAAATKAALLTLLSGDMPSRVTIALLTGDNINIAVHAGARLSQTQARCSVIKDAGDDPDITHKAEIGARVTLREPSGNPDDKSTAIRITCCHRAAKRDAKARCSPGKSGKYGYVKCEADIGRSFD